MDNRSLFLRCDPEPSNQSFLCALNQSPFPRAYPKDYSFLLSSERRAARCRPRIPDPDPDGFFFAYGHLNCNCSRGLLVIGLCHSLITINDHYEIRIMRYEVLSFSEATASTLSLSTRNIG